MLSRAYRVAPEERVPDEVRRIARGRIDHAIDELSGNSENSRAKAVHEARKDMKKLRGLLRLVRGELGGETFARENACFRDAARELAGARDRDVMLETLANLTYLPAGDGWELRKRIQADGEENGGEGDREAAGQRLERVALERPVVHALPRLLQDGHGIPGGPHAFPRPVLPPLDLNRLAQIEADAGWQLERTERLEHHVGVARAGELAGRVAEAGVLAREGVVAELSAR